MVWEGHGFLAVPYKSTKYSALALRFVAYRLPSGAKARVLIASGRHG
jgi:hypothetical protein